MVVTKGMKEKVIDFLILMVLGMGLLLCIFPVINAVAVSFSDKAAAAAGNVYFWPVKFNFSSYRFILDDSNFLNAFAISLERVVIGGALNFVMTVSMAYPLSKGRKTFRAGNAYVWVVVFTMLFSGGLIPWYMTIKACNLLDKIWALVLPGAVPAFNVILLMNFFRGVPAEIEEAGVIDGAGIWRLLFKIYIPISLPAMATVTLFSIVDHWNSFFDGLILMNAHHYPLQTYIQQLVVALNEISRLTPEEIKRLSEVSNKTLNMAKIVVSMVPILLVYPFLQRYFMSGIVLGSVKE
jgi:ABC-type sugar transport system, permease component